MPGMAWSRHGPVPGMAWCHLLLLVAGAAALKQGRLMNPLSLVTFPNSQCSSDQGTGECFSAPECIGRGGRSDNTCASGFGVCCYHAMTTCGGTVTRNHTYLRNPGYADSYNTAGTCSYTINKISKDDICFIRLDFDTMVLAGPRTGDTTATPNGQDSTCEIDTQTITEGVSRRAIFYPPVYCGIGTGLHMYISAFEGLDVSATLAIAIGSASTIGRKWNIRVTQIECDNRGRPPTTECLQYFTGTTGTLKSWNFDGGDSYIRGQNYGICIRREKTMCAIQYVQTESTKSFSWGSNPASGGRAGQEKCETQYVAIPGGSVTGSPIGSVDRFCGGKFGVTVAGPTFQAASNAVITKRKPFRVYVFRRADRGHTYQAGRLKLGFELYYTQLLCEAS